MIPHILFVDDDEAIRKTLSEYLKSKGMDVSTAESGEEAMRLMQGTSFNLVILDLNLGKESGLDILDHFKMLNPSLPVIIFTSQGDDLDPLTEALAKGATGYLNKSESVDILINEIQRALQVGSSVR